MCPATCVTVKATSHSRPPAVTDQSRPVTGRKAPRANSVAASRSAGRTASHYHTDPGDGAGHSLEQAHALRRCVLAPVPIDGYSCHAAAPRRHRICARNAPPHRRLEVSSNAGSRTRDPCLRSDAGPISHLGTPAYTCRVSSVPPSTADKIASARGHGARGSAATRRDRGLPLAARRANATIFAASGPVAASESQPGRSRFRIESDGRRRGCATWMRVAYSAALRSSTIRRASKATGRDPEGSAARHGDPRADRGRGRPAGWRPPRRSTHDSRVPVPSPPLECSWRRPRLGVTIFLVVLCRERG